MRSILFINQFYYPDHSATSQLLAQLAESLAVKDFSVTVLTGNARYEGGHLAENFIEVVNDVRIVRVRSTQFGKSNAIGRLFDYVSFYLSTVIKVVLLPKHHTVVILTTPPMISFVGRIAQWWKGSRFVYWIQDLYPDVAVALGSLRRNSFLTGVFQRISKGVLKSADGLVVVGMDMASKVVGLGASPGRVRVISNWADEETIRPQPSCSNSFRSSKDLQDKFVALYAGNFGKAHCVAEILEAARELRDDAAIHFLFVGSGSRKEEIEDFIEHHELKNVQLVPYVPQDELCGMLNAADVGLVTQLPATAGLVVPSKSYGLMAAGKPIIFVGPEDCYGAYTIKRAGCGIVVTPGDVDGLVRAVREFKEDCLKREKMGQAGRERFLEHHSRNKSLLKFKDFLSSLDLAPSDHESAMVGAEIFDKDAPSRSVLHEHEEVKS